MARVLRGHPDLTPVAVVRRYLDAVAPESVVGSCLYHGRQGCTLPRTLRADLCNRFHCNGLRAFLQLNPLPNAVIVVAGSNGETRRSGVLRPTAPEANAAGE